MPPDDLRALRDVEGPELDHRGRLRSIPADDFDPVAERVGAEAAGEMGARRFLGKGMPPGRIIRQVVGRARRLATGWPGTDHDREEWVKGWKRGTAGCWRAGPETTHRCRAAR